MFTMRVPFLLLTALLVCAAGLTAKSDLWVTNIDEAKTMAAEKERHILLEFTGSDWCPPCKAMARDVFDTETFEAYAADNLVPVFLDFPRDPGKLSKEQAEHNYELQSQYGIRGYPTIILLDAAGQEVARHVGYFPGGPEKFIAFLDDKMGS